MSVDQEHAASSTQDPKAPTSSNETDPEISCLIGEYTDIVNASGVGSDEALAFREQYARHSRLITLANTVDAMRRKLDG